MSLQLISPTCRHSLTSPKPNGEVSLQAGKAVPSVSVTQHGKFVLKVEKRTADLVDYLNANYVLVATGSSQQVWESPSLCILSKYNVSQSYILNIFLTCRAIQLLHNLVTPLFHQCPAYSHLRLQTSDWLILLGYAPTNAISIPMLRIILSSNVRVMFQNSCSQIA